MELGGKVIKSKILPSRASARGYKLSLQCTSVEPQFSHHVKEYIDLKDQVRAYKRGQLGYSSVEKVPG